MNFLLLCTILLSSLKHPFGHTERPYKNLYGANDFSKNMINNGLDFLEGFSNTLIESQIFLKSEPPDMTPKNGDHYDFIVIGAGTAGATLAARLSEMHGMSVLLIEAGGSETLFMDIPLAVNILQESSLVNWKYLTAPSTSYCLGFKNNRCKWPRGKVMGGSSVLNYMIATRGHPRDYDRWAQLGNEGWSWNDVLPYFKKLETRSSEKQKDYEIRGYSGPVNLEFPSFHTPIAQAFVEAGLELGYNISDYNGRLFPGFSYIETTIKNGMRMSSNVAYLHPVKGRQNLFVTKNSLVEKLIIATNSTRVIGVTFIKAGRKIQVYAKKEIVLSAGTIGSAQLLMLSGIGRADHLKSFGITPIVDAAVGENLMDHIASGAVIFRVNQSVTIDLPSILNPLNPYARDFFVKRSGPIAIPGAAEALAFIDTDSSPDVIDSYPNMELLFISSSFVSISMIRECFGITLKVWNETYANVDGANTWTVFPILLRPKSRGKIVLKSNSIYKKPRIIPNYMADKEDVRILIAGVRATLKVANTKAMQKFGSKLIPTPVAGCGKFGIDSDEYWECAIRTITMNIYHYSGTCKMGPQDDKTAVVDPRLKVYGVSGLRVGDASIIPEIISGHTNIPVYMIAEKLADMIKEDWGYPIDKIN